MVINFYGNTNSICIGNGQVIRNGVPVSVSCEQKEINEYRCSQKDERINIVSIFSTTVDVEIVSSNLQIVEAKLCGKCALEGGDIKFDAFTNNGTYTIKVDVEGILACSNLKLKVYLPKANINSIFTECTSANVRLNTVGSPKVLILNSLSGDITVNSDFTRVSATTQSGDIRINANSKNDIAIEASTLSGDIEVILQNILFPFVSAKSVSGKMSNTYKCSAGFKAGLFLQTLSGDIVIK